MRDRWPTLRRRLASVAQYAWASPTTFVGVGVAVIARVTGGRWLLVDGVVETHGGFATWILRRVVPLKDGATAMTLGHVVIGLDAAALDLTRAHERVHVRQYERWGPLFVPAYFAASAIAFAKRRDLYRDNRFEREAYGSQSESSATDRLDG